MKKFDVIIVGCGVYGSSISYYLASQGVKTLTLEKFAPNHPYGSSHGMTRIIRTAYAEDPLYVPLVRRARDLWFDLQKQSGLEVMRLTGGLQIGSPNGSLVAGATASAKQHGIDYELLYPSEIIDRFPVFRPSDDQVGVLEKNAGILFAEQSVKAYVELAHENGAVFNFLEPLASWKVEDAKRVIVSTGKDEYEGSSIIFAAGSWLGNLLPNIELPLSIERQTVFWMHPKINSDLLTSNKMPIFIFEEKDDPSSGQIFYGTPDVGSGLKVGKHHGGVIFPEPNVVKREITKDDEQSIRSFLERRIPIANGSVASSTTCIYTNTPDGNFIVDTHPEHSNVRFVSACSGHGFKFASIIGKIVAEEILGERSELDLSSFRFSRFATTKP